MTVVLFDTARLSQVDPAVNPKDPEYLQAIRTLLALVRREAPSDVRLKYLVRQSSPSHMNECQLTNSISRLATESFAVALANYSPMETGLS